MAKLMQIKSQCVHCTDSLGNDQDPPCAPPFVWLGCARRWGTHLGAGGGMASSAGEIHRSIWPRSRHRYRRAGLLPIDYRAFGDSRLSSRTAREEIASSRSRRFSTLTTIILSCLHRRETSRCTLSSTAIFPTIRNIGSDRARFQHDHRGCREGGLALQDN
jgi:hypothetical protein